MLYCCFSAAAQLAHAGGPELFPFNRQEWNVKGEVLILDAGSVMNSYIDDDSCNNACARTPGCNAWVFCNNEQGCGQGCKAHTQQNPARECPSGAPKLLGSCHGRDILRACAASRMHACSAGVLCCRLLMVPACISELSRYHPAAEAASP